MTNLQGKMMINSIKFGGYMGVPNFQTHPDGSLNFFGEIYWYTMVCEAECHCHSRHLQPQTSGCHLAAFKWPSASLCLRPLVFDVGPWSLKELILGENIWITGVLCL